MKFVITGICLFTAFSGFALPKATYSEDLTTSAFRSITHNSFKVGEKLTYKLHFGVIDAGTAEISVKSTKRTVQGRELLHVVCEGRSNASFDLFYKVRDRYESYIDKQGVFPWVFVRRVDEGGFKFEQDYTFYQNKKLVDNGKGKQFTVPDNVQDIISAYFYGRTIDFSDAKLNQEYNIQCFLDDEIHNLRVKYKGKEVVKLRNGKFKCLKFQPVVVKGRIFKKEDDLTVYVTDDANKIPILVKADVIFGTVKMEVTSYEGLSHKIAKVN